MARKSIPVDVQNQVFHLCGFRCANPSCRTVIPLEIHHLQRVAEDGPDEVGNLICLCPTCHTMHHKGMIPASSIRVWHRLLIALNEAFPRGVADILILVSKSGAHNSIEVSGDGLLQASAAISSGYLEFERHDHSTPVNYSLKLSPKGKEFLRIWMQGDETALAVTLEGNATVEANLTVN